MNKLRDNIYERYNKNDQIDAFMQDKKQEVKRNTHNLIKMCNSIEEQVQEKRIE